MGLAQRNCSQSRSGLSSHVTFRQDTEMVDTARFSAVISVVSGCDRVDAGTACPTLPNSIKSPLSGSEPSLKMQDQSS